jgi:hypothetical protein
MCEIAVTCPSCGRTVTAEQEISCSRTGGSSLVQWICRCGSLVTLQSRSTQTANG